MGAEISALWLPIQLWSCGSHEAKFPALAPLLWLPRAVSLYPLPPKDSAAYELKFVSRSQSWKWEPRVRKSAPIELARSRSCTNGSGYSQMCPGSWLAPSEPNGSYMKRPKTKSTGHRDYFTDVFISAVVLCMVRTKICLRGSILRPPFVRT